MNSYNKGNQKSPITNNSEKGICIVNRQNDEWFVKKIDFKPFDDESSLQKLRMEKQSPLILHSNQDVIEPFSPD
jgi:hypothetical protein